MCIRDSIAEALIVPAAGGVDRAGLVHGLDDLHGRLAVKLAPALVERHPHGDARVVVAVSYTHRCV